VLVAGVVAYSRNSAVPIAGKHRLLRARSRPPGFVRTPADDDQLRRHRAVRQLGGDQTIAGDRDGQLSACVATASLTLGAAEQSQGACRLRLVQLFDRWVRAVDADVGEAFVGVLHDALDSAKRRIASARSASASSRIWAVDILGKSPRL
jgi:hypothetical protein